MPTTSTPFTMVSTYQSITSDSRTPGNPSVVQTSVPITVASDYVAGVSNPSWSVQIAKGVDASTPYSRRVVQRAVPAAFSCGVRTLPSGVTSSYTIDVAAKWVIPPQVRDFGITDLGTQDAALGRFRNELSGISGKVALAAPVAESRELAALVKQGIGLTAGFLTALAKAKRDKGRRMTKFVADTYLAWSFGMRPLVGDIQKAGEAIRKKLEGRFDEIARVSKSASTSSVNGFTLPYSDPMPIGTRMRVRGFTSTLVSYRYVGAFGFKFQSSEDYGILETLGFTVSAAVPASWELLPFSWIADYFGTIGSFLEDEFTSPGGSLIYLNLCRRTTLQTQINYDVEIVPGNPNNVYFTHCSGGTSFVDYVDFSRSSLASLPTRSIRVRSLNEIGRYSIPKLLNLVAILAK